jgi:UDP-N-acetylmuramoyl-tripeptide--D-alanyl-D-alanine ligase
MYELGEESLAEHKYIVDFLTKNSSFECYFIGKYFFENKSENANFHFYESFEMFSNSLRNTNWKDKTILIKGSRGMALERTLEYI